VFGKEARGEVDADLCVAMGAAIQGGAIAGVEVSAVLVDVTHYTFGTSALGYLDGEVYPYCYVPIIKKNTPIPVRKSEAFATFRDNQSGVDVRIFQGENSNARENIELGKFSVEGLSRVPAGNPILVDLELDRDGILHVSAKEKNTGLERRISIDNAMPRYSKEELDNARQRIGSLFGPENTENGSTSPSTPNGSTNVTDPALAELVAKAQAKLEVVGEEDRAELIDLIGAIRDGQQDTPGAVIDQARKQLSDLLFYLET